ncbi:hypothetical protein, partial [Fusobacterium sp. FSA-380-WT-2B]|uniref:hypothetical protein n=1 Tax=Fusobacterium sp. FSA-380-WT-2B TaxID=2605786 RepID=UPI001E4092EF
ISNLAEEVIFLHPILFLAASSSFFALSKPTALSLVCFQRSTISSLPNSTISFGKGVSFKSKKPLLESIEEYIFSYSGKYILNHL